MTTQSDFTAVSNIDHISEAIATANVIVEECKLHLTEDGITIRAVDPANVAMVDLSLSPASFESYSLPDDTSKITVGIDLDRFSDVLSMGDTGELVHLKLNRETRKLQVTTGGLEYTLALIDPDAVRQEPDLPDLDLTAEIVIAPKDIAQAVRATDMVSDHVALGVAPEEDHLYVVAEGDTDTVDIKYDANTLIELTPGDAHSLYSLEYLKDINRAFSHTEEVCIELGEEFPAMFDMEFANGNGHATFMLAPRIQNS